MLIKLDRIMEISVNLEYCSVKFQNLQLKITLKIDKGKKNLVVGINNCINILLNKKKNTLTNFHTIYTENVEDAFQNLYFSKINIYIFFISIMIFKLISNFLLQSPLIKVMYLTHIERIWNIYFYCEMFVLKLKLNYKVNEKGWPPHVTFRRCNKWISSV